MTSHPDFLSYKSSYCIKIIQCHGLCRHRGKKTHIKIFLPSHQSIIRTHVSHIHCPVSQVCRKCSKLCLDILIHNIAVSGKLNFPKPCTGSGFPHKKWRLPDKALYFLKFFLVMILKKCVTSLFQSYR